MGKTVLLIINIGSPKSTSLGDVRRYLRKFLNDSRVMTMPALARFILVNGIIVPFRAPKSAKIYSKVWTEKGSPLLVYSGEFVRKLQIRFGDKIEVCNTMLYGEPRLEDVLKEHENTIEKLIVLPMYPQYASSTTGSAVEHVLKTIQQWTNIPEVRTIGSFFNHSAYVNVMIGQLTKFDLNSYDHLLFSYHGLPISHIKEAHPDGIICSSNEDLTSASHQNAPFCYRAQCLETSKMILNGIELPLSISTSNSFQSRLSKDWLEPFTDETLIRLAKEGNKKILVVCPSFVVDCLETLYEISDEYKELFIRSGGEDLVLVPALNANDDWVEAVHSIVGK